MNRLIFATILLLAGNVWAGPPASPPVDVSGSISTHNSDTTAVHGIADTSTVSTGAHTVVDDTPNDGNTTEAASSNSVYDHINGNLHAWVVGATSVLTLNTPIVLDEAEGNEYAQSLFYQTNKATSGDDTGFLISHRDTASPGTSYCLRVGMNTDGTIGTHTNKFTVDNTGYVDIANKITVGNSISSRATSSPLSLQVGVQANNTSASVEVTPTLAGASGVTPTLKIAPTIAQSGTAGATDVMINRTESSLGSGAQKLIEAQVATVPKFTVWNTGGVTIGKYTADPCTVIGEGSIFYNDTSNYMCYCNNTADVKMSDDTTACF